MATRIKAVRKSVAMPTLGMLQQSINAELAKFAVIKLNEAIHAGEGSARYDRFVNGVEGAPETSVRVPGAILYNFHWWNEIIEFGLELLMKNSPVKSGRFKSSWFAMINGAVVSDYSRIPIGATVILTNNQPYSRKIEVGFMRMSVPPGVVETSRKDLMARYGNVVQAKASMIYLPGGYILKGHFRKGIRPYSRKKLRPDTAAGAEMKYPSMILTMRE